MEFNFKISELFRDDISIIDCSLIPRGLQVVASKQRQYKEYLTTIINELGKASAEAQGLACEITSKEKLMNTDNKIYLKVDRIRNKAIGYIKTGTKKLFLFDTAGNHHELDPLCVLDFYVHESMQRKGCGKELFDFMVQHEKIEPHQLAINRPSQKFMAFLGKHYSLRKIIPQMNRFVIFDKFFVGRTIPVNRRQWHYDDDDDDDDNDSKLSRLQQQQQYHQQQQYQQQQQQYHHQQHQPQQRQQFPQHSNQHNISINETTTPPHHQHHQHRHHHNSQPSSPYSPNINHDDNNGDGGEYNAFNKNNIARVKSANAVTINIKQQHNNTMTSKNNNNNSLMSSSSKNVNNKTVTSSNNNIVSSNNNNNNISNNNSNINTANNSSPLSEPQNYSRRHMDTSWNIFGVEGPISSIGVGSNNNNNKL